MLGRDFTAEEDSAGGDNQVAILTHEMWQRHLGGDPAIVGKPVRLNNRAYTVVGVLAPGALNQPNVDRLEAYVRGCTRVRRFTIYDHNGAQVQAVHSGCGQG